MKMPWVSRELYERVAEDLLRSEAERTRLLDLLLGRGPSALEELASVLPSPDSPEVEEYLDRKSGAMTPSGLRQMAQTAANKRAGLKG